MNTPNFTGNQVIAYLGGTLCVGALIGMVITMAELQCEPKQSIAPAESISQVKS